MRLRIVFDSTLSEAQRLDGESRPGVGAVWGACCCLVLTLVAVQLALGPKIRFSEWRAGASTNAGIAEGLAWLDGRLDLPCSGDPRDPANRLYDTAFCDGRAYNVYPPLVSAIAASYGGFQKAFGGLGDVWPRWFCIFVAFAPLVIVGFVVFHRRTGDGAWSGLFTLAWIGGTALAPMLRQTRIGWIAETNHVLSQVGLLILAGDVLGRQRIWPGLVGLAISAYARHITFLYGLVLLVVAWRGGGRRGLLACGAGLLAIAAPLLVLNALKFDHPLDFGYGHVYVGRDGDDMARRYRGHGAFSTGYISENAWYMHAAPPRVEEIGITGVRLRHGNAYGTSVWITTPLALWVVLTAGRWRRERGAAALVLGTLPVMLGLLCYHSPGYLELGYSRFALDFLPIWLVVVAPHTRGGWRTWLTLAAAAWGLWYFHEMVPDAEAWDV